MTPNTPALPSASTLEVVGYLRATKDGKPVWSEDCVCEDPVYPSDPDGSDADTVSMAVCRLSDAQAEIQALRADARRLDWLSGRDLNDLAVGYLEGKVLLNIGCGDIFEGDDLRGAIDHARKYGQPS